MNYQVAYNFTLSYNSYHNCIEIGREPYVSHDPNSHLRVSAGSLMEHYWWTPKWSEVLKHLRVIE